MPRSTLFSLALALALSLTLVNAATFQQVLVPSTVGAFTPRSRGQLTKVVWTQSFNYVLSYGVTSFGSYEHLNLLRVLNGTLYRRLANTTFQLEQYGFSIGTKAIIQVPPQAALDQLATSRTRGAVALVYLNTTRSFNTSLGTSDQPFLTLNGGNSNGSLSDLTLQLFFALNMTADPTQPDGFHYQSDPKFGAYSSGSAAMYAREGHTGGVSRVNIGSTGYARLYYFGGKNSSMWINSVYYQEPSTPSLNSTVVFVEVPALGTLPSPRAYHGMAILDDPVSKTQSRYIIIWGGEIGTDTYTNDGPFVFDIATKTWLNHAATGGPSARMGHSLVNLGDPDVIYVFGGMSGPGPNYVFYNDLWSYRISNRSWTQLQVGTGGSQSAIYGGAEVLPTARAFHHAAVFDSTTFLFFGGESSLGPLNDFWYVNVNVTCPYYCQHPIDGFKGACMDYQQCHFIKDCSWDPASAFQCFLGCDADPSMCASKISAFTCPPEAPVKCWSGFCQTDIRNCKPYPGCQAGERRCDNGDCVPEATSCTPVICNPGQKLCADGTCQTDCMPSYGCLPDDKAIQCGDGTCKTAWSECNLACNATYPKKCWYDCVGATDRCEQPYWTDDIHLLAFTTPVQTYYRLYRKDGTIEDPQDLRGIIHLDKVPPGFNLTIYMKSAFNSELREVGPHPTWPKEFDASYLRSIFVKTNVTNVINAYASGSGGINVILRMKLNEIEKSYWSYHPGHGLGYIAATNCIAYAIPWFWDDMDLEPNYALENISYIKAYRDMKAAEKLNQTYTGPAPNPPALRWQCQLLEPGNAWPRFTNVSDDIMDPTADRYVGIRVTDDFYERIMGIIYAPFPLPTPAAAKPNPQLPPANRPATYVVLALAALLLLILIIIVLFKTFGQRN